MLVFDFASPHEETGAFPLTRGLKSECLQADSQNIWSRIHVKPLTQDMGVVFFQHHYMLKRDVPEVQIISKVFCSGE